MPSPRKDESRDDFMERCMGDAEARRDFPDRAQRFRFCQSQWRRKNEEAMSTIEIDRRLCRIPAQFELLAKEEPEEGKPAKRRQFKGLAHTGAIMRHPFVGALALDMSGAEIPDAKIPVLMQHDARERVGFSDKGQTKVQGGNLVTRGQFLKSSTAAQAALADADEGFPWQMSVFAEPTKVEQVEAGEEAEVNGETLHGPGMIFREWGVGEISFTPMGMDPNTKVAALAGGEETIRAELTTTERDMAKDTTPPQDLTADGLRASHPDLVATFAKEGTEAERERILGILEACHQRQYPLALGHVRDGSSTTDTLKALLADKDAHKDARRKQVAAAADPDVVAAAAPDDDTPSEPAGFASEEALRQWWDANPAIHGEFMDDFKSFCSYKRGKAANCTAIHGDKEA